MSSDTDRHGKRVEVYEDDAGEYRWRRFEENGAETGKSEEGYVEHGYALEVAAKRNPGYPVVDVVTLEREELDTD